MEWNTLENEPPTLSRHLMETLRGWSSLHGLTVVFVFLTTVSKGSSCEAPSSPMCFRGTADESVYRCEWRYENTTESDVTFDLYYDETPFGSSKKTWALINEKLLIKKRPVEIWVEAHAGHWSCASNRTSVELQHIIKYGAPVSISMSWFKNNLSLSWKAAEKHPALAEIWFRRGENPAESWEKRTTTTTSDTKYHAVVVNLLKDSVYQVQIRHRSTQAQNPLWSDWSSVVTVPAELEQKPEVTMTTRLLNGTREVKITWKPMPHAAAVGGLTYSLRDTQSSHGCPCLENRRPITMTEHTTYVSLSAVNINVTARNTAGCSPPAVIQVPAQPAADLKICDKTLLDKKLNKKTCLELYELQDEDSRPVNVIMLTAKKKKRERDNIKDYVRYLYFEHRCDDDGRPQTVKMCLFYEKEGAPLKEPQEFIAFSETHSSANLSWKAIPVVEQHGFLTHYRLCSVKISSHNETRECRNISASVMKHRLENLTPGTKYNISLVGVTRAGEGPEATVIVNMPEKPVNVLWSLSLFLFLLITTVCTCILKRIKNKIYPPVPTPVIPDFTTYQPESQEFLEGKVEEVHELTLQQLHPEDRSDPQDPEEPTVLTGGWEDGSDEDPEDRSGGSGMSGGTGDEGLNPGSTEEALRSSRDLEQLDNEIDKLIYRNGLVFDVKTDSP